MTFGLLFIVSVTLNIIQYNKHISNRNYNVKMYQYYISEHEVTFNNAFSILKSQVIIDYIHNPDQISIIIEGIQHAEFCYLVASKYADQALTHKQAESYMQSRILIDRYLSELRAYRSYLQVNKDEYRDINQITIVISDLQMISTWLNEKYKNNDFEVYTDKDFYQEVYVHLKSDVKNDIRQGFVHS